MDDDYSLANLLRACLLLGARTGSDALREWAHHELHGYSPDDDVPDYRRKSLPLFRDTISGNYVMRGEQIHRELVPSDLRDGVPEFVEFKQSIDELESIASESEPNRIGLETFPLVTAMWSRKLPMFQDVTSMYYRPTRAMFVAMVGTVRTTLVEIVADLVSDAPITLPSKAKVDSAVNVRINNVTGDHNEVSVASNSGAVGAGTRSRQIVNTGILPDELTELFASVRDLASKVGNEDDRADVEQAIDDFEGEITQPEPQPGKVRTRARTLLALCEKIALPALTSAATTLTTSGLSGLGIG
ncbi:hypothetical protein GPOL_c31970 [Gordonia polyisoprenivorans VH2]|uniref:AbiTii domain-containing protein n=1 Tax=Gordonia polyisoprenivorans (strain DSM 44266 / VH2) TaxID=1112204 RepID=H6MX94_GORPV|nr:hypothetical protein GPOL_c31970 [Gordonia polyisoprenivorans VH2]